MKILVVDDEPINIEIIASALVADYTILEADRGHKAITIIKNDFPDLVLLDVMMPDMNGFDVCRIIKSDPAFAHIPVIFLTAMDSNSGEAEGLDAGGIDYLTKPVNLTLLKLRVRNHLDLKEQTDLVTAQRDLLASQKAELEKTLARVNLLEGIIPICMHCKNIRNDQNTWEQLEQYFQEHSEAMFSHGICPDCRQKHYSDLV